MNEHMMDIAMDSLLNHKKPHHIVIKGNAEKIQKYFEEREYGYI